MLLRMCEKDISFNFFCGSYVQKHYISTSIADGDGANYYCWQVNENC